MQHLLARQSTLVNVHQKSSPAGPSAVQPLTTLEHNANLNIDKIRAHAPHLVRKTSIICTIGPKTNTPEMLAKLRQAGMSIARLNFSHGTFEYHKKCIENIRKSDQFVVNGRPVGIALDTKGPEIRTGLTYNQEDVQLTQGSTVIVTTNKEYAEKCSSEIIYVDYKSLPTSMSVGKLIYVDDGLISLEVTEIGSDFVKATVKNSAKLGSKKGVNLPDTRVDLPAISDYDREALKFGVENDVDIVFASFIRKASDVMEVKDALGEKGKDIIVISKIENHEGVENFADILKVTDGVMVARGDLGIEIPPEKVFLAQKMMVARCNMVGKPVICATQMLESMTTNPRPTRAEVSDVANAVLDGVDCVMLSGETAKGNYPMEAVTMMNKICVEAEYATFYASYYNEVRMVTVPDNDVETLCAAAVNAALEKNIGAIVCLTTTGNTARLLSKYRPRCPIITVTRNAHVARISHLYRGCYPLHIDMDREVEWQQDVDKRISYACDQAIAMGLLEKGTTVIAVQGWRSGIGYTNTIRFVKV